MKNFKLELDHLRECIESYEYSYNEYKKLVTVPFEFVIDDYTDFAYTVKYSIDDANITISYMSGTQSTHIMITVFDNVLLNIHIDNSNDIRDTLLFIHIVLSRASW